MKRGCDILFFNYIKPIQDGAVRDYSRIGGTKSPPPLPKICHTYPAMMKVRTYIPYLK